MFTDSHTADPPEPSTRFAEFFEVVPALTDALRDEVYHLRHSVYCEDLGFEPVRPDGQERDPYDAHSLHCLMRRATRARESVGCVRVVLAIQDGQPREMPFERLCSNVIDRSLADLSQLPRDRIGEVSRLAVHREFRRRRGEFSGAANPSEDDFGSVERPRFPHVLIGLYVAAIATAHRRGLTSLFVLTEPRLARHFDRVGVPIVPIGPPVDFRGQRLPSLIDVAATVESLRPMGRPIWTAVNCQFDAALEGFSA